MGTIPPDAATIDEWLGKSGATRQLLNSSFTPNKGFHVQAVVVGYTTPEGSHQFSILTGDPTKSEMAARQLYGLQAAFGGITVRAYDYEEPLPQISPQAMAAGNNIQERIADMSNWVPSARS